jgi:hypothetical protein
MRCWNISSDGRIRPNCKDRSHWVVGHDGENVMSDDGEAMALARARVCSVLLQRKESVTGNLLCTRRRPRTRFPGNQLRPEEPALTEGRPVQSTPT